MRSQGRRAAGPVWADWFLELEEMLERRKASRSAQRRPTSRQSHSSAGGRARGN